MAISVALTPVFMAKLAVAGVVCVAGAAGAAFLLRPAPSPAVAPAAFALPQAAIPASPVGIVPSFDVVRVGPQGNAVIAGRADVIYDQHEGRPDHLAIVDYKLGRPDASRAALAELVRQGGDNSLYQQAQVLAQTGQSTAALDALERAVTAGDTGLVILRNDPLLDPLRAEPRFVALKARLKFPA